MANVDGFSLTNCIFASTSTTFVVNVTRVSNGTFQHDTFGTTWVNVVHAADVRIDQNTFNASYQQNYSHRVVLSSNSLVSQTRGSSLTPAMIISNSGSSNHIVGNVMDGKWAGSGQTETDDGVVITDESGDTVSGNTISNVFDCGIETLGMIANATISNNDITRAGFCGIGGWYWNSLRASTISGNVASDVPRLFYFFRIFGLRPAGFEGQHELPADAAVYFSDNVFDGNRLVNPSVVGSWSSICASTISSTTRARSAAPPASGPLGHRISSSPTTLSATTTSAMQPWPRTSEHRSSPVWLSTAVGTSATTATAPRTRSSAIDHSCQAGLVPPVGGDDSFVSLRRVIRHTIR